MVDDIFKTLFGDLASQDLHQIMKDEEHLTEAGKLKDRGKSATQDPRLELDALYGQDHAKQQIVKLIKTIREKKIQSPAIVITGPSGIGKTTIAGILERSLDRSKLPSSWQRLPHLALKSSDALSRALDELFSSSRFGTLVFEDGLIREHTPILKQILTHVEHQNKLGGAGKAVLITFDRTEGLGPQERTILRNYFLGDVELKALDQAALMGYAETLLLGFTLQEPAKKQLRLRLEHAQRQESFAHYVTIQRIAEQILDQQRSRIAQSSEAEAIHLARSIIYSDVTEDPNDHGEVGSSQGPDALELRMSELESLTGLTQLKRHIRRLVAFIRVTQSRQKPLNNQSLHMVFTGNPGTGKTTVARLLGGIFCELKLLTGGHLIETERSELVAGFVGQTAIKTKEKLLAAQGGVLFIDEAYTLHRGTSEDAYGQEAIDTILKGMEDLRGQFVLIIAGYSQEMATFMNSNPGLKSRFPLSFEFPDFTPKELREIALTQASKLGFSFQVEALEKLLDIVEEARVKPNFGNARTVRNVLEQSIRNHAERIVKLGDPSGLDAAILNTLTEADIEEVGAT